jgi:hypothetical protein
MSELVAYIGNCLIGGEEFSTYPDGTRTRDIIRLTVDGRNVLLRQNPDFIRKSGIQDFKGQFVPVTSFLFQEAEEEDIPALLQLSNLICELLSFATESRVVLYGHDFPVAGAVR